MANQPQWSALDRPLANPNSQTVPASTFIYLLRSIVEISTGGDDKEDRIYRLGQQVGRRTVGLAVANDRTNQAQFRDLTTEEAARFVATVMWKRWFDHPAPQCFKHANFNLIDDELPIIPLHVKDNGVTCEGRPFVAGMIKGALDACGFNCEVTFTDTSPTTDKPPVTQFVIQWAPVVLQRDRRRLQ